MTDMHTHELNEVMALYRACHPGWPERPREWFVLMNSMVLRSKGKVVAWTAMTLSPPPTADLSQRLGPNALCAWLVDTCVAESHRGQGLAGNLMDMRLRLAEAAGCCMAIGACAVNNTPMQKLLASRGFKCVSLAANAFPDGSTGEIYVKNLGS